MLRIMRKLLELMDKYVLVSRVSMFHSPLASVKREVMEVGGVTADLFKFTRYTCTAEKDY